jgi:hypothetical protein
VLGKKLIGQLLTHIAYKLLRPTDLPVPPASTAEALRTTSMADPEDVLDQPGAMPRRAAGECTM